MKNMSQEIIPSIPESFPPSLSNQVSYILSAPLPPKQRLNHLKFLATQNPQHADAILEYADFFENTNNARMGLKEPIQRTQEIQPPVPRDLLREGGVNPDTLRTDNTIPKGAGHNDELKMPRPHEDSIYMNFPHDYDRRYVNAPSRVPVGPDFNEEGLVNRVSAPIPGQKGMHMTSMSYDNSFGKPETSIGIGKEWSKNGFYIASDISAVIKQFGEDITIGQLAKYYYEKTGKTLPIKGDPNRLVKEEKHKLLIVPLFRAGIKNTKKIAGGNIQWGIEISAVPPIKFDEEGRKTPFVHGGNVFFEINF